MWAAGLGQEDAVKVLLEHHANFDAETGDDNMCPLGSAMEANSLPCVELQGLMSMLRLVKQQGMVKQLLCSLLLIMVMQKLLTAYYKLELILMLLMRMVISQYMLQLQEAIGQLLKLYWPSHHRFRVFLNVVWMESLSLCHLIIGENRE